MLKQNEVIELVTGVHSKIEELKNGKDIYKGVIFEQRYNEVIDRLEIIKRELE